MQMLNPTCGVDRDPRGVVRLTICNAGPLNILGSAAIQGVRAGLQRAPIFRWTRRDDEPGPETRTIAHRIADTPPSVRIAGGLQARDIGNERDPEFGRAPRRGRAGRIDAGSSPAGAGLHEDQQAGNEDEDAGRQVPNRRSP